MFDRDIERGELWVEPEAAWWLKVDTGRPSNKCQHHIKHPLILGNWSKLAAEAARVECENLQFQRKSQAFFFMQSSREDGYARPGHPGHD